MHFIRVQIGLRPGYGALERHLNSKLALLVIWFCTLIQKISFPSSKAVKDKRVTRKWRNRLVPAILVGVSIRCSCRCAQAYQVVLLASLLSENRASRVSITTVADIIFPEVVSFPLRQRLTLNCAFEDTIRPAPPCH